MAMMAMTTNNSMGVKAGQPRSDAVRLSGLFHK